MAGRSPAAIEAGLTEELVAEIGTDVPRQMTPAEHAAVTFASKLATDHLSVSDADKAALRQHFDPEQVVELALFSVLCMVGRFTMLVGLEEESCPI
jgi:alkylhydroperoxidase family enzyme